VRRGVFGDRGVRAKTARPEWGVERMVKRGEEGTVEVEVVEVVEDASEVGEPGEPWDGTIRGRSGRASNGLLVSPMMGIGVPWIKGIVVATGRVAVGPLAAGVFFECPLKGVAVCRIEVAKKGRWIDDISRIACREDGQRKGQFLLLLLLLRLGDKDDGVVDMIALTIGILTNKAGSIAWWVVKRVGRKSEAARKERSKDVENLYGGQ
jgi:hypothetical protein